jgi:15-cis-phytoene synthase
MMAQTKRSAAAMLRSGSSSFHAASLLLAPEMRESVRLLYAWCRRLDDIVDGQFMGHQSPDHGGHAPSDKSSSLDDLRCATISACRGDPQSDPVFQGLAQVIARHRISEAEPLALLDGFAMDKIGRHYASLEDTLDYCWHVAGVVGLMMLRLMEERRTDLAERACDLGLAFQLTNIARDVIDDHRIGRVYLPERWLHREGLDRQTLADPANRPGLARVVCRLLDEAERYYDSAAVGIQQLPLRPRWAIGTALLSYRAIGRRIASAGPAAWDRRSVVPTSRKAAFALMAGFNAIVVHSPLQAMASRSDTLWSRG